MSNSILWLMRLKSCKKRGKCSKKEQMLDWRGRRKFGQQENLNELSSSKFSATFLEKYIHSFYFQRLENKRLIVIGYPTFS